MRGGIDMIKAIFNEDVPLTTKVAMCLLALTPLLLKGSIMSASSTWFGEPEIPNCYKK